MRYTVRARMQNIQSNISNSSHFYDGRVPEGPKHIKAGHPLLCMENSFTLYTLTALHRCECKTLTHTVQAGYNIHTYSSEMLTQAKEECFSQGQVRCNTHCARQHEAHDPGDWT